MNGSPNRRRRATLSVAAATLVAATGCTMCPDPYDYSGPVPNGSAPQNDFRARSNGILPVGAAPKPWPPIVDVDPGPGEAGPPVAGEEVPAACQLSDAADEPNAQDPGGAVGPAATVGRIPDVSADADAVVREAAAEEPLVDVLPPPATRRPAMLPRLRETPGWRPKG